MAGVLSMFRRTLQLAALAILAATAVYVPAAGAEAIRLKDLGKFAGWRDNPLVGYGLVTGLAGTGDSSSNKATRQALANMLGQFDTALAPEQISSRNVAAVMVTASLPPFATEGNTLDVTVTSIGDARSLTGGTLLLTPLKAANGKVYALAQGPLSVGGYKYDMNGNVVQKNHPTVGSIPAGATVEVSLRQAAPGQEGRLAFLLNQADYTNAVRVATAINAMAGGEIANPRNAEAIDVRIPEAMQPKVAHFIAALEGLDIVPDRRARVVVNERTGTVVSGGDVRIDKVAISQGDLKITITTETSVSQPILVRQTGPDVRTAAIDNSRVEVKETAETGYVAATHNTVADLIQSLTRIKTSTRDIISILRAIKAAGALHADLIIQ